MRDTNTPGETWIRTRSAHRARTLTGAALALAVAASLGLAGPASASTVAKPSTVSHPSATTYGPVARYVVRAHAKHLPALLADLKARGVTVTRTVPLIDAAVASMPASTAGALGHDPLVAEVTADTAVTLASSGYDAVADAGSAYNAATLVGAHDAWTRGYTGRGIDVALIDSGVTRVTGLAAAGQVVDGPDLSFESQTPALLHLDTFGHGTFMAGLINGRDPGVDAKATDSVDYQGIAPDARVISVKVADAQGRTDVSQVIAGIDWVVQHAHDPGYNIRVLNLSFGTASKQSYLLDPLAYAAEVAWRNGIVVVVSAGNSGNTPLADPAMDPFVIAVGALDNAGTVSTSDDKVASFSAVGTSARRVDLIAPGVHVQGLRVPGSFIDLQYGVTGRLGARFFRGSGTSEASAITAGVAALVLSRNPSLTPDQVKRLLTTTAKLAAKGGTTQGKGVPNALRAALGVPGSAVSQKFAASTGTGTLEGARGGTHVARNGVQLSGEQDIFGNPVSTTALAVAEKARTSWTGGRWNGATWAGASWDGASWDGASWDGASWDGASWDGASWDGASWNGASWDGASWSGASWAGVKWSAVTLTSMVSSVVSSSATWSTTGWQ